MEINRERFEAWLFSQPRERKFEYWESDRAQKTGCLLCNFFRETIAKPHTGIGEENYRFGAYGTEVAFPEWLRRLLPRGFRPYTHIGDSSFTAGEIQTRYRELFPDFEAPVEQPDKPISFRGIQPK